MAVIEREVRGVERHDIAHPEQVPIRPKGANFWGALRLLMGATFFWAFLDKLLALGFSTGRDAETGAIDFFGPAAWISGGQPTAGLLSNGLSTKEPFLGFYQSIAGAAWVDWAYMLSFAAIGLGLLLGIGTRLAAIGGATWMLFIYTAVAIWPKNNPVVDNHVVYAVVLLGLAWVGAGRWLGLGERWRRTELVQRFPILE